MRRLVRLLAPLVTLAALVGLLIGAGERRYRRIRREIVERDDAREAPPDRASPIEEAAGSLRPTDAAKEWSGYRLLPDGPDALAARLALIAAATRTLDLQYYIWHDDLAGRVVARAVLAAAERGVRCRILLDDLHASGTRDLVETLAAHPRVTVRIFNPSLTRRAYYMHWLFAFSRMNKRMHNKALVADEAAAITGGRNVGDDYFGLAAGMNFRDCDVLALGPAAREIGRSFERYWTGELAFPAAAFGIEEDAPDPELRRRMDELEAAIVEGVEGERPHGAEEASATLRRVEARERPQPTLREALADLTWCPSRLLDDPPDMRADAENRVADALGRALADVRETLEIETGYLVPGRKGVRRFRALVGSGVRCRVLTNSFATNDVLAAQAGYAKYRRGLLRAGVELHELKPDAAVRRLGSLLRGSIAGSRANTSGVAGLHSKVILADGTTSFIGSFNLDPRSARDNSEVVLAVEGAAFGARVAAFLNEGRAAENSFHLTMREDAVIWHDSGAEDTREPGLTGPATLAAAIVQRLPVERLL